MIQLEKNSKNCSMFLVRGYDFSKERTEYMKKEDDLLRKLKIENLLR